MMMFDKRFAAEYHSAAYYGRSVGGVASAVTAGIGKRAVKQWPQMRAQLQRDLKSGKIPFLEERAAPPDGAGAHDDVASGEHMLSRFTSLRQAVVSVRLGRLAWEASGYGELATAIEELGSGAGLPAASAAVGAMPPAALVVQKYGVCEVNDYVDEQLGFEVIGWRNARSACDERWVHKQYKQ